MSNSKTTPIIVLGMHRSGTSCLAGTLEEAGVNLGDVSTGNIYNKKGNRENNTIMSINNDVLQYNDASWYSPPKRVSWTSSHIKRASDFGSKFEGHSISQHWGFKDPRVLVTFPFWKEAFPNAILLGTIRNPADVAASLHCRDENFSLQKGLALWLEYNKHLLALLKEAPFPLLSFDQPSDLYIKNTKKILAEILPETDTAKPSFFENSLRSTTKENNIIIPEEVRSCYEALQSYLT